jgi:molecular chaperone DnaK
LAQEKLEKLFGKKLNKSLNPDLCVSMGAAIQGSILNGGESNILLLDVIPISIGIETMGGVFTKMIEANTTIPTKKSQVFSTAADNQPSVEVHILQGERPMAANNKSLGRFFLEGIPPAPRGVPQIDIEMNIDANGILIVEAHDKGTGKKQQMRIEGSSNLSDDEKDRMIREAKENEEADKKERESIEKLNMADSMVFQTRKQIKDLGDKITEEDKNKLEDVLKKLENDYQNKLIDNIDDHMKEITEVWNEISTRIYQSEQAEQPPVNESETSNEDVKDVDYEEVSK